MKQIYNIMVGMALMLGVTSCEKEILDNGQAAGIALADGQFIVDYSGEVTTRAIKDNAEKGERINSLTYLLYIQQDNDYVLEKRREIPGLNKTNADGNPVYESWPLTRDNMTWEQREALKDTLMVGSNYRAVFVANAAPSLWGEANDDDMAKSPLKEADEINVDTYSSAYLQLPEDLAFNDGNMFYLAEAEINGAGKDRNTPYNCPITLKRVVTRTDWWFERLPEWDILSDDDDTNNEYIYEIEPNDDDLILPANVEEYIENLVSDLFLGIWNSQFSTSIIGDTNDFLKKLVDYFTEKGYDSENKVWTDATYESYVEAIQAVITSLEADEGRSLYLTNVLNGDGSSENLMNLITNNFIIGYANNISVRKEWHASWRKGLYAEIQYDATNNPQGNRYWFDGKVTHGDGSTNTSPHVEVDMSNSELVDGLIFDGFHFIGLANPELNGVEQINWYEGTTNLNLPLVVPTEISANEQGVNERYQILYRPMVALALKDTWNSESIPLGFTCNLAKSLPFTFEEEGGSLTSDALFGAINEALKDEALSEYAGSTIEAFSFTLSIPDLSKGTFDIVNRWNSPVRVY